MRSSLGVAALSLAFLFSMPCWVSAQTHGAEARRQEQQDTARLPIVQQERMDTGLNWLSQQLSLTGQQKAKLQRILINEGLQMRSIRENTLSTDDLKRSQVMQLHQFRTFEIESILKPDQRRKFAQIEQRTRETYRGNAGSRGETVADQK